jgi:D-amino-acid dehydrogenase
MGRATSQIDIAIVGAGMLGCAAAARLAEEGASVVVFDERGVGSGASGRNSGAIEHPYDAAQRSVYEASLRLLRKLGVSLPESPVGVLLLERDEAVVAAIAEEMGDQYPELDPRVLDPDELLALEPAIAPGHRACRVETGFPVPPRLTTELFAQKAQQHGAKFVIGAPAALLWDGRTCLGVRVGGEDVLAAHVIVAAGSVTSRVVDPEGRWVPVFPSWGVNLEMSMTSTPRHVLLEAAVARAQTGEAPALEHAFSLVSAGDRTALGSTFLLYEPEPEAWEARMIERACSFVPALRTASITGRTACARPRSIDGRPLLGRVEGADNLLVATGNGGRGISTGAACGRLVADSVLRGSDELIPPPLRADRFPFHAGHAPLALKRGGGRR